MQRRDLFKAGLGASIATVVGSRLAAPVDARPANEPFSLNFAPEFRTFASSAGPDEIENLRFMHAAGFRAVQDITLNRRPIEQQTALGNEAQRLGMTVGAFLINHRTFKTMDLVMGVPAACELFLTEVEEAIETSKRVGARWLIAVPGFESPRLERPRQISNIIELFKRASALLEPHGLIMVVEPVSWVDGALLIRDLADAHLLCKAVGNPSCKILCDLFHQQMQRGNLVDSMEQSWDEIAYFHIGDVPGRSEPTSGEINYRTVFSYIRAKGYRGILGMEHSNSRPGRQGDAAVIAAYREVDRPAALSIEAIKAALAQRSNWR